MHPGAALARITLASHGQPVITWLFQDITLLCVFPTDKSVCLGKKKKINFVSLYMRQLPKYFFLSFYFFFFSPYSSLLASCFTTLLMSGIQNSVVCLINVIHAYEWLFSMNIHVPFKCFFRRMNYASFPTSQKY